MAKKVTVARGNTTFKTGTLDVRKAASVRLTDKPASPETKRVLKKAVKRHGDALARLANR